MHSQTSILFTLIAEMDKEKAICESTQGLVFRLALSSTCHQSINYLVCSLQLLKNFSLWTCQWWTIIDLLHSLMSTTN